MNEQKDNQINSGFIIFKTDVEQIANDRKAQVSVAFFKKAQNKIHFAVHGPTAPK